MDTNGNKKKKGSVFKKILLGAFIGLIFGLFVAIGYKAFTLASSLVKGFVPKNSFSFSFETGDPAEGEGEGLVDGLVKEAEALVDNKEEDDEQKVEIKKAKDILPEAIPKTTVTDVTEVVKATIPSLVAVNNKYTQKMNYFGYSFSEENEASGSGIIIGQNDTELLIATNAHVIEGANELIVTFVDDTQVSAQIKGADTKRDLAVITVQIDDIDEATRDAIVIAEIGDSDALTVGEPVIAIGNSLGYGQSVTTGVVSALNRMLGAAVTSEGVPTNDDDEPTFIQTDAAINPGNSGGALLNSAGQVIGINSNKLGGDAIEGMGYAIPITDARPIIEELMNKQTKIKVDEDDKGYLGIEGIDVKAEYSEIYGMPEGFFVSGVAEGSGAEKAGLVRGDIIVAVNGEEVSGIEELSRELDYYKIGDTIELTIMQGSPTGYQSKDVNVTLGPKQEVSSDENPDDAEETEDAEDIED